MENEVERFESGSKSSSFVKVNSISLSVSFCHVSDLIMLDFPSIVSFAFAYELAL